MQAKYLILTRNVPTITFIGVTTSQSSIMQLFYLWAQELGLRDAGIVGQDIPLNAEPQDYRAAVAQLKYDPLSLGALVTTHKINLLNSTRDMFDYLDNLVILSGEVSCISKRDGRLEGFAKDPTAAGLAIDSMLGPGYFGKSGGEVLLFGSGGAGTAIVLYFLSRTRQDDRPSRITAVDNDPGKIVRLTNIIGLTTQSIAVEPIVSNDPRENDDLMARLPDYSLVVNATGMGKDRPGSPITNEGVFPMHGIVWEANYRGKLDFLHQALRQSERRSLIVEDGWQYFLHGWTEVIAQVFGIEITASTFDHLAEVAQPFKPRWE